MRIGVVGMGWVGSSVAISTLQSGLPTELPTELRGPQLAVAMRTDKKIAGGRVRFVAIEDIGRTRTVELAGSEIVKHL